MHRLLEDYVLGKPTTSSDFTALDLFNQIKPALNKSLGKVYYQEVGLYSDTIKIAGRVDLIGEWDGELAVIDYKSSKRLKTKDQIENYFLQTCFYSLALQEMTGYQAKKLVVVIGTDSENTASVFIEERGNYVKKLVEVKRAYDKIKTA